ncbi:hypothetical protein [Streptacidiphilus rugosus]|uniref:hypothetical protein n=1 Tax=Streptacidiphilus rugosus TaxID=405783 RepID=UPI0005690755|nr:hypothetical protein [Streptacidiphilus rugosus]
MTTASTEQQLAGCGLAVLGPVADTGLPSTAWAMHLVAGVHQPTSAVPLAGGRLGDRVDAEWLRLAREHGIVDGDGVFLVALARGLPWIEVRLTDETRLSEHLTGANRSSGEGEFVTMARDGSVMCGVTTEEYDVWLVVDGELLHTIPPPAPRPDEVDLSQLNFMQLNVVFAPERLKPPHQDGWVLLGLLRMTGRLVRLHELPEPAARLPWFPASAETGVPPRPLTADQVGELGSVAGFPVDDGKLAYCLEYQSAETKSRQNRARTLPR